MKPWRKKQKRTRDNKKGDPVETSNIKVNASNGKKSLDSPGGGPTTFSGRELTFLMKKKKGKKTHSWEKDLLMGKEGREKTPGGGVILGRGKASSPDPEGAAFERGEESPPTQKAPNPERSRGLLLENWTRRRKGGNAWGDAGEEKGGGPPSSAALPSQGVEDVSGIETFEGGGASSFPGGTSGCLPGWQTNGRETFRPGGRTLSLRGRGTSWDLLRVAGKMRKQTKEVERRKKRKNKPLVTSQSRLKKAVRRFLNSGRSEKTLNARKEETDFGSEQAGQPQAAPQGSPPQLAKRRTGNNERVPPRKKMGSISKKIPTREMGPTPGEQANPVDPRLGPKARNTDVPREADMRGFGLGATPEGAFSLQRKNPLSTPSRKRGTISSPLEPGKRKDIGGGG